MTSMPEYKVPKLDAYQKARVISLSVVSILVLGLIVTFIIGGPTGAGIYMFGLIVLLLVSALFGILYVGMRELLTQHFENRRRR